MKMKIFLVLLAVVAIAAAAPEKHKKAPTKQKKAYIRSQTEHCTEYPCLVFDDEFDTLDLSTWQHEITAGGGGNWEFQYYTNNRSNSYVRDGVLYMRPTLTETTFGEGFVDSGTLSLWGHQPNNICTGNAWWGCERVGTNQNYINPIQSARLRSSHGFSFTYGRIEVRARLPKGDWIWPAVWMLSRHNQYGDWPASGEIDIFESRGNRDLTSEDSHVGHNHAGMTMHWGPYMPHNGYSLTSGWMNDDTFADAFHNYRIDWERNHLRGYIDDVLVMDADPPPGGFWEWGGWDQTLPPENNPWQYGDRMAPFDSDFYIIMNVAVGGTNGYFHDSFINGGYQKPWSNESPTAPKDFYDAVDLWFPTWQGESAAMAIDHVKVWKLEEDD